MITDPRDRACHPAELYHGFIIAGIGKNDRSVLYVLRNGTTDLQCRIVLITQSWQCGERTGGVHTVLQGQLIDTRVGCSVVGITYRYRCVRDAHIASAGRVERKHRGNIPRAGREKTDLLIVIVDPRGRGAGCSTATQSAIRRWRVRGECGLDRCTHIMSLPSIGITGTCMRNTCEILEIGQRLRRRIGLRERYACQQQKYRHQQLSHDVTGWGSGRVMHWSVMLKDHNGLFDPIFHLFRYQQ